MTAIPDIPIPDEWGTTHLIDGCKVQAVATVGDYTVCRYSIAGDAFMVATKRLDPLPSPLPKARVDWFVLAESGHLTPRSLDGAWRAFDVLPDTYAAVVKLCADGVLRHVDRDGNEGAPLEVEQ